MKTFLASLIAAFIVLLLALKIAPIFLNAKNEKYLSFNGVRGMAIIHKNKPYTLNFDQQNSMIEMLNLSIPLQKLPANQAKTPVNFEKIIIYQFDTPDLVLKPKEYLNDELIFSVPEWNSKLSMKDTSQGKLKKLLEQTFDP